MRSLDSCTLASSMATSALAARVYSWLTPARPPRLVRCSLACAKLTSEACPGRCQLCSWASNFTPHIGSKTWVAAMLLLVYHVVQHTLQHLLAQRVRQRFKPPDGQVVPGQPLCNGQPQRSLWPAVQRCHPPLHKPACQARLPSSAWHCKHKAALAPPVSQCRHKPPHWASTWAVLALLAAAPALGALKACLTIFFKEFCTSAWLAQVRQAAWPSSCRSRTHLPAASPLQRPAAWEAR